MSFIKDVSAVIIPCVLIFLWSCEDETFDDNFEINNHNISENDFFNTNNEPSLSKGASETGNSGVNKRKRKSGNTIQKLTDNKRAH